MTEVRVIPDERSTRRVYDTDAEAPRSEHHRLHRGPARRAGSRRGPGRRTGGRLRPLPRAHDAPPASAGVAPREQLARARLLDRVREGARTLARAAR